jgi:hypothetical protein
VICPDPRSEKTPSVRLGDLAHCKAAKVEKLVDALEGSETWIWDMARRLTTAGPSTRLCTKCGARNSMGAATIRPSICNKRIVVFRELDSLFQQDDKALLDELA